MDSEQQLAKLYEQYFPKLMIFCRNMTGCNTDDAEDLSQDILIQAYEKQGRFNPKYAFSTWLYRIARNRCIDWLRKNSRLRQFASADFQLERLADTYSDPAGELERNQLQKRITTCLNTLAPDDRAIAFLFFYRDEKLREIARVIDKPLGTVKYRIHAIKKKMQAALEDRHD